MWFTEDFKKQVVKKVLSPGVIQKQVCKKLKISESSVKKWKDRYRAEISNEIQEIDVGALLYEPPVDIEELLRKSDYEDLKQISGSEVLAQQMDLIRRAKKDVSQYTDADRYAVVMSFRGIPVEQRGIWLRQLGLQSPHIKLWEDTLITMSRKPIDNAQYTKQLEEEVQRLKRNLAEAERDNRELKILIELKKKYPTLFQQDEDKN